MTIQMETATRSTAKVTIMATENMMTLLPMSKLSIPKAQSSKNVELQRVHSCEGTTVDLGLDDGLQTIAAIKSAIL